MYEEKQRSALGNKTNLRREIHIIIIIRNMTYHGPTVQLSSCATNEHSTHKHNDKRDSDAPNLVLHDPFSDGLAPADIRMQQDGREPVLQQATALV